MSIVLENQAKSLPEAEWQRRATELIGRMTLEDAKALCRVLRDRQHGCVEHMKQQAAGLAGMAGLFGKRSTRVDSAVEVEETNQASSEGGCSTGGSFDSAFARVDSTLEMGRSLWLVARDAVNTSFGSTDEASKYSGLLLATGR